MEKLGDSEEVGQSQISEDLACLTISPGSGSQWSDVNHGYFFNVFNFCDLVP